MSIMLDACILLLEVHPPITVALTLLIKGVSHVQHVSVSNIDTTSTHVIIFNYVIFSNYYQTIHKTNKIKILKWEWIKIKFLERPIRDIPQERDACSDHTKERRNQPRCDRRMKWRNRSWIHRVSTPFHQPIMVQHDKSGSMKQYIKQQRKSSCSSLLLDPNTKQRLVFVQVLFDFSVWVWNTPIKY